MHCVSFTIYGSSNKTTIHTLNACFPRRGKDVKFKRYDDGYVSGTYIVYTDYESERQKREEKEEEEEGEEKNKRANFEILKTDALSDEEYADCFASLDGLKFTIVVVELNPVTFCANVGDRSRIGKLEENGDEIENGVLQKFDKPTAVFGPSCGVMYCVDVSILYDCVLEMKKDVAPDNRFYPESRSANWDEHLREEREARENKRRELERNYCSFLFLEKLKIYNFLRTESFSDRPIAFVFHLFEGNRRTDEMDSDLAKRTDTASSFYAFSEASIKNHSAKNRSQALMVEIATHLFEHADFERFLKNRRRSKNDKISVYFSRSSFESERSEGSDDFESFLEIFEKVANRKKASFDWKKFARVRDIENLTKFVLRDSLVFYKSEGKKNRKESALKELIVLGGVKDKKNGRAEENDDYDDNNKI